ncbi:MAG: TIGR03986 family CRISPR-associated RAMP protein [Alphaproteobacteria bacterium]|nr:MAG: TIGR03986 family CRISPR-associated RAMP protein [Alphaproteobacteria bacterium]
MSNDRFYNNYHFVPLSSHGAGEHLGSDAADFRKNGPGHDGHDRYDKDLYSGRIVCVLEVDTPLVVGANITSGTKGANDESAYGRVTPFELNGQPALPATSLKGMISSVAEAASGSAARVFGEDFPVTFRKMARDALSAMGIIERDGDTFYVRPLVVPVVQIDGTHSSYCINSKPERSKLWEAAFHRFKGVKGYLGNYRGGSLKDYSLDGEQGGLPNHKMAAESLGARHYAAINPAVFTKTDIASVIRGLGPDRKMAKKPANTFIGFNLTDVFSSAGPSRTAGHVRVFEVAGRDIPNTKKHELFIPDPAECRNDRLLLRPEVIATFDALALERAQSNNNNRVGSSRDGGKKSGEWLPALERLPYLPDMPGMAEQWREDPATGAVVPALTEGQIVYFDIANFADAEGKPIVSEISFSAVWRDCSRYTEDGTPKCATLGRFARQETDPEILPYSADRTRISIVERMFGFVEGDKKGGRRAKNSHRVAFSGKLRFSHGVLPPGTDASTVLDDEIPLKILATPKPPAPALYFRHKGPSYRPIRKKDLSVDRHDLQGRKFYLHQEAQADAQPWKTKVPLVDGPDVDRTASQKNRVRPIKSGTRFWFHIDFDNLNVNELSLLCFALQPSERFRHKLGMGKPLGLGSVQLVPQGLFLIDRAGRYGGQSLFDTQRYGRCLPGRREDQLWFEQPAYRHERQLCEQSLQGSGSAPFMACSAEWHAKHGAKGKPLHNQISALLAIGENTFPAPGGNAQETFVHYPLEAGQLASGRRRAAELEGEGFKWAVANEKRAEQFANSLHGSKHPKVAPAGEAAARQYSALEPIKNGQIEPMKAVSTPPPKKR